MRKIRKTAASPVDGRAANRSMGKILQSIASGSFDSDLIKKSIYGPDAVKEQLLKDQHYKCAYCEKSVKDEIRDVEHFRPKSECKQDKSSTITYRGYWWLAYDWNNLLFSCEICNRPKKNNYFPLATPHSANPTPQSVASEVPLLINPYVEDPKDHIYFEKNVVYAKNNSVKGQTTIDVLDLNRPELRDGRRLDRWGTFMALFKALKKINPSDPDYNQTKQDIEDLFFSDSSEFAGMFENQLNQIVL